MYRQACNHRLIMCSKHAGYLATREKFHLNALGIQAEVMPACYGVYHRVRYVVEEPLPLNIIILPYGYLGYSTLWQAVSRMYLRMAGDYVTAYTPSALARSPAVQMFYPGKLAPGVQDGIARFVRQKVYGR
jgi:hypothetical protein